MLDVMGECAIFQDLTQEEFDWLVRLIDKTSPKMEYRVENYKRPLTIDEMDLDIEL